jgi:hypothetical protein
MQIGASLSLEDLIDCRIKPLLNGDDLLNYSILFTEVVELLFIDCKSNDLSFDCRVDKYHFTFLFASI